MRRYEGLLRPSVRPAGWPARWIAVTTEGEPIRVDQRSTVRATGLRQWRASVVEFRGPQAQLVESACGTTAGGLWRLIDAVAERPGLTWILSSRALYDWTLLGLWERIEAGQVAIKPSRSRRRASSHERGTGRESGLLITGDPPSAALLLVGPQRRSVLWVCARNYGWRLAGAPSDGVDDPARLVAALDSASRLLSRHRLGGWCCTVGAMAERAWRSQHLKESLYVHECAKAATLESLAGTGGRVWASVARGRVAGAYAVDARGLYPYLCAHTLLPGRLVSHCDDPGRSAVVVRKRPGRACARVRIRTTVPRYPRRRNGQTDYPVGTFQTVLAGPELEEAVKENAILEVGEANEYDLSSPLAAFALATYEMRCEAESRGDATSAALGKALGVALVGKLSQREVKWEEVIPDYNDPFWGEWYGPTADGGITTYRSVAGIVSRKVDVGLAAHAVPQIPIWVWSHGRNWLWQRMQVAGLASVLYADTDGLIVTSAGYARLRDAGCIRDSEWGELRHVSGPETCEVLGPKAVRIGDRIVQAGAPVDQRGESADTSGYWFRRPFHATERGWIDGAWMEEFRTSRKAE